MHSAIKAASADPESLIATLTTVSAALVAVALALIAVVPSLSSQAQAASGRFTAQHFNRIFRFAFTVLLAAVAFLVLSATIGIAGVFWPSNGLADAVGILAALGIVALAVGVGGFAIVTFQALLR
jgi:predicted anti-sigma-YlaC factor YlaD